MAFRGFGWAEWSFKAGSLDASEKLQRPVMSFVYMTFELDCRDVHDKPNFRSTESLRVLGLSGRVWFPSLSNMKSRCGNSLYPHMQRMARKPPPVWGFLPQGMRPRAKGRRGARKPNPSP